MNRKKKIKQILKKKLKKAKAKAAPPSNKPRYIAKADRVEETAPEKSDSEQLQVYMRPFH